MGRPAQDRTAHILEAARACFEDTGPSSTTIDAIAARAGVGKGTVFLYWPNKARLLRAVSALDEARRASQLRADLRRDPHRLTIGWVAAYGLPNLPDLPYLRSLALNLQTSMDQAGELFRDGHLPRLDEKLVAVLHRHGLVREATVDETVRGIELVVIGAAFRTLTCSGSDADLRDDIAHVIERAYGTDAAADTRVRAEADVIDVLDTHIADLVEIAAPDRPTDIDLTALAAPSVAQAE